MEERTVFIIEYQEKAAIRKRPPKGLLASLYELPNAEGKLSPKEAEAYLAVSEDDLVCLKPLPAVSYTHLGSQTAQKYLTETVCGVA